MTLSLPLCELLGTLTIASAVPWSYLGPTCIELAGPLIIFVGGWEATNHEYVRQQLIRQIDTAKSCSQFTQ
eukprot:6478972-Amphidinium_carterae.1